MEMQYCALSFSHKRASIALREKLAFGDEGAMLEFLHSLSIEGTGGIEGVEVMGLSTCNRTEFYFYTHSPQDLRESILKALASRRDIPLEALRECEGFYTQMEAIYHVFCVASSLDSLIIGETQIAGQLKKAYKTSLDSGLCGRGLTRLLHFAFKCASKVRNQTQISSNTTSVASVAVHQANALQKSHGFTKRALVVGMGEMGILCLKHLLSDGYEVMLCNRDFQKAQAFIAQQDSKNLRACSLEALGGHLQEYPLLFSATGSSEPVIVESMVREVGFLRFWFDLALPRDIQIPSIGGIEVFVVDDLKQIAQDNLAQRKEHLHAAHAIVGKMAAEFSSWLQTLGIEPLIKNIRLLAKDACLKELARALKKGYIPQECEENTKKLLHQAFNRFLHQPTQNLRTQASSQESDIITEAIKSFFGIQEEAKLLNAYKCEYDTK